MKTLAAILAEFFGLFVDDGSLALQLVLLIAAVAALVKLGPLAPLTGGIVLLLGCLAILALSLSRTLRK